MEYPILETYESDATKDNLREVNTDGNITKIQTITNKKKNISKLEVGNLSLSKKVTKDEDTITDDTTVFTFRGVDKKVFLI